MGASLAVTTTACACLLLLAGEWQNGFMHGVGTFEAPDGSKYQVCLFDFGCACVLGA
jgi:hypothetical protein